MDTKQTQDLQNSLAPAARTASANGSGVDLASFASATVAFSVGTITDGTHTPKVQESDDNSTFTDVAAADLIGILAALASNVNQRVGYRGTKRYIRAVTTIAGATSGGVYAGVVIRGDARKQPVA
jgi:carbon monoxide dehydrogenase subunit G